MRNLEVWYTQFEIESCLPDLRARIDAKMRQPARPTRRKGAPPRQHAGVRASWQPRWTGEHRIVSKPPLIVRLDDFVTGAERDSARDALERMLREYSATLQHDSRKLLEQFRLVDIARKVVGVGSVGTACLDRAAPRPQRQRRPLLQIKEAQPSVLEEFVGASEYPNAGERVVPGSASCRRRATSSSAGSPSTRASTARTRLLRPAAARLEGVRGRRGDEREGADGLQRSCVLRPWHTRHARSGDRVAIARVPRRRHRVRPGAARILRAYAEQNERDYAAVGAPAGGARGGGGRGLARPAAALTATVPACPSASASGRSHPGGRAHAPLRRQGRAVRGAAARIECARGEGRRRRPGSAGNPRSEGRAEARRAGHKVVQAALPAPVAGAAGATVA